MRSLTQNPGLGGQLGRGWNTTQSVPATWPWAHAIATAWARITALPHAP